MKLIGDELEALRQRQARVPNLALPFALLGAAAGWLTGRSLAGPLFMGASSHDVAYPASAAGGIVGALAGLALGRLCRAHLHGPMTLLRHLPVAAVVLVAGTVSGAVADLGLPHSMGWLHSAGLGLVAGLAALPIALFVLAAARRTARARLGSLVAGADRRAVWAALATTVALATLVALPEWKVYEPRIYLFPVPALGIGLACVGIGLVVAWRDRRALRQLRQLGDDATSMSELPSDRARDLGPSVACCDLGLGEQARVAMSKDATYRRPPSVERLLVGDFEVATAALQRASTRHAIALALALGAVLVHVTAAADGALEVMIDPTARVSTVSPFWGGPP